MEQYINPQTGETVYRNPGEQLPYGGGVWQPIGGAGGPVQGGTYVPQPSYGAPPTTQSYAPSPSQNISMGSTDTFVLGQQLASNPAINRLVRFVFGLIAAVLGIAIVICLAIAGVEAAYDSMNKRYEAAHLNKPTIYSATELKWTSKWPWAIGKPRYMVGENAFVTGNVDNLYLSAFGNLTMEGDVSNSRLESNGTITVGNVRNTTMTAHKIVITGRAVNVKKVILRPLPNIPLPRSLH